jgi:hypothetical protein
VKLHTLKNGVKGHVPVKKERVLIRNGRISALFFLVPKSPSIMRQASFRRTGAFDYQGGHERHQDLHQRGLSILLVEQNFKMALATAVYIYILNKGRIVHESSPSDLRNNKEIIRTYLSVAASSKI